AGFPIVAAVPLAVTDDRAAAMAAFRAELTRYVEQPFYRTMLQAAGLGDGVAAFDRDRRVPDALAEALGGIRDPRAARTYVEAYGKAGVTLPAVRPITFPDAPWYRRTVEEAAGWWAAGWPRFWRGWWRAGGPSRRGGAARSLPAARDAEILYVALGDSTVEGVGASRHENNYVSLLHARLRAIYHNARLQNLGVGGATSADVLARQLEPAIASRPDLVTLSVGPNDITEGV